MTSLQERAAKMARADEPAGNWPSAVEPGTGGPAAAPEQLPDIDIEVPEGGPEIVPVHVAWSRVMADVRAIAKGGEGNEYNGPGAYSFRGIDRTVNAFGPVLRKHGVLVLPVEVKPEWRDARTSGGKPTTETRVVVSWLVMGPAGDQLPMLLQSAGEALDSSDKGTAKAQSIAQRVVLLTAAQVPTNDPDPDSVNVERGEASIRPAGSYVEEITNPRTSRPRLLQIHHELKATGQLGALVTNEVGDDEAIGPMVVRIGKERAANAS